MNFKTEIEKQYGKQIYDHAEKLNEWVGWYKGYVEDYHKYKIPQGAGRKKEVTRLSLGMGKSIGENYANLLVNEKTDVVLATEEDNNLLNKVLNNLFFWSKENEGVEKEYALGGIGSLIQIETAINKNTGELVVQDDSKIHYEIIDATRTYPLSWRYGEVEEIAFISFGTFEGNIVMHVLNEQGNYDIKNLVYTRKDKNQEWELQDIQVFNTNSKVKLFSYSKPNMANNIDFENPTGISIYANAIDTLKSIDAIYDGYYYEFVLGKKRVFASASLTMINDEGKQVKTFDENDLGVYVLPIDDDGKNKLNFEEGTLRAESYSKALNDYLSLLSYQTGLGKEFFKFGGDSGRPIQTATGIVAQNSELFRNISKQEIYIEKHLKEAIRGIIYACNKYTNTKFSKDYELDEIQIKFDDSIFEDKDAQKENDRKDVQLGIMSKIEYREKWYAETEETSKEKLTLNVDYLSKALNDLLPAITSKIISPKQVCMLLYGKEDTEIINYIQAGLDANNLNVDDVMAQFGA